MKKTFYYVSAVVSCGLLLSACNHSPASKPLKIANPASQYCVEQGGKLRPVKDEAGNHINYCQLPDGTEKEEWALYRQAHSA